MKRWKLAAVGLLAVLALYTWTTRTARYQTTGIVGRPAFVVLDTATGLFWVYEERREESGRKYVLVQSERPVAFTWRLFTPTD